MFSLEIALIIGKTIDSCCFLWRMVETCGRNPVSFSFMVVHPFFIGIKEGRASQRYAGIRYIDVLRGLLESHYVCMTAGIQTIVDCLVQ